MDFSSPARDQTPGPWQWECGVLTSGLPENSAHILNYIFRSVPTSGIIGSKDVITFTAFEMICQIILWKIYSLLPFLWTLAITQ